MSISVLDFSMLSLMKHFNNKLLFFFLGIFAKSHLSNISPRLCLLHCKINNVICDVTAERCRIYKMWSGQGTDIRPHSFNIFFQRSLGMLSILTPWEMQVLPSTSACKLSLHHPHQANPGKIWGTWCNFRYNFCHISHLHINSKFWCYPALDGELWEGIIMFRFLHHLQLVPSPVQDDSHHFSPHYSRITFAKGLGPPNRSGFDCFSPIDSTTFQI